MGMEAKMVQWLYNFWLEEGGQDLIEYALVIFFIAVACLAFAYSGTPYVNGLWSKENSDLVSANSAASGG